MIIVPLSTDAPVYHYPWMTIAIGVLNIVAFFLTGKGFDENNELWKASVLHLGSHQMNPVEWATMNFVHYGYMHLLGNMFFLWGFGILVEGKIGAWKFLLVYMLIGITGGAVFQSSCYFISGMNVKAMGASLALFGLLSISLIWAPKNDVTYFYMVGYYLGVSEVSIMTFGFYYIAFQIFIGLFFLLILGLGFVILILSQIGHLVGAAIGFAVGMFMLKKKLVDCENWDIIAVMKGTYGSTDEFAKYRNTGFLFPSVNEDQADSIEDDETEEEKQKRKKKKKFDALGYEMPLEDDKYDPEVFSRKKDSREYKLLKRLKFNLKIGDADNVIIAYNKIRQLDPDWQMEILDQKSLIDLLCQYEDWVHAIPFMEDYLKRSPGLNPAMRIKMAAMFVEVYQRPRRAVAVLKPLKRNQLKEKQGQFYDRILAIAKKQIRQGVVEFEGEHSRESDDE